MLRDCTFPNITQSQDTKCDRKCNLFLHESPFARWQRRALEPVSAGLDTSASSTGVVACTLPSGRVAVLGGHGEHGVYRQDGELYNPAMGRWACSRYMWGLYSGDYIVGAMAVSHGMVVTTMKGYSLLFDEESQHCVRPPKSTFTGESRESLVHVSVPTSALTNEVASDRRGDQSSSNVAL
eukprot:COSAG02_NODE_1263_length_13548_cov_13.881627_8_plen_181_part_00